MTARTRAKRVLLIGGVFAVFGAGLAYAAIPGSDGTINGCYEKRTGLLRVIDAEVNKKCLSFETPIKWNEKGLKGDQGLQGLQGEKGVQGDRGEQGLQGVQGERGLQGLPGADGAQGPPGLPGSIVGPGAIFQQSATVVEGNDGVSALARCPEGKHVLGGGYVIPNTASGAGVRITGNSPSTATGGPATGWLVSARHPEKLGGWNVVAYAICA